MKFFEKWNNNKPLADPFSSEAMAYGRKLEADKNELYIKAASRLREKVMSVLNKLVSDNSNLDVGTAVQRVYKFKIVSDCDFIGFYGRTVDTIDNGINKFRHIDWYDFDNHYDSFGNDVTHKLFADGSYSVPKIELVNFKQEGYYPIPWSESYKNFGIVYILLESICPLIKQMKEVRNIDVIVTKVLDTRDIHRVIANVEVTYEVSKADNRSKRM